nr:PREDICTED: uncharacterized protein LOC107078201 isoform X2 [Lepisosteus oculatus]
MSLIDTTIKRNSCICKVNQNHSSALASEPTNPFGGGELESLDCSWAASCLERVSEGEEEEEEWLQWAQTCTSESLLQRRRDSDMRLHALLLLGVCWLNVPTSPQSDNRQLTRAVGQSVTFQIPVLQRGYLKYGESTTIAAVLNSEFSVFGKFKGTERFTWDRATGFFTITALSSEDAGVYTVERKEEEHTMTVEFSLTVYRADDSVLLYAGAAGGGAVCLGIVALVLYCRLRGKKPRDEDSSPSNNGAPESYPEEVAYAALDMKRQKLRAAPPAGEQHTVYAEVKGGGGQREAL